MKNHLSLTKITYPALALLFSIATTTNCMLSEKFSQTETMDIDEVMENILGKPSLQTKLTEATKKTEENGNSILKKIIIKIEKIQDSQKITSPFQAKNTVTAPMLKALKTFKNIALHLSNFTIQDPEIEFLADTKEKSKILKNNSMFKDYIYRICIKALKKCSSSQSQEDLINEHVQLFNQECHILQTNILNYGSYLFQNLQEILIKKSNAYERLLCRQKGFWTHPATTTFDLQADLRSQLLTQDYEDSEKKESELKVSITQNNRKIELLKKIDALSSSF